MPGVLSGSMLADRTGVGAAAPPDPSLGEQFAASFRLGTDDTGWAADTERKNGYMEVYDALVGDLSFADRVKFGQRVPMNRSNYDGFTSFVWTQLQERRARDPNFLPSIPKDQESFEAALLDRQKVRRAKDKSLTARGSGTASTLTQFAGSMASSFTDPVNVGTLPIGAGGTTVLSAAARNAGLNALIEAFEQPLVVKGQRERLGEELTVEEAAINIGAAGAFGGVLGGAAKGLELHGGAIADRVASGREAVLAEIYPRLPEAVRNRFGRIEDVPDSALADLVEGALGRDNLTPDEVAALHVMRREDDIASVNPFVRNGAGIAAHADNLRAAMERILSDVPPRPASTDMRASTAISSGTVDMSARAVVKRRIGVVESAGSATARNPRSSATGVYQFTSGTWRTLYKRRYGAQGLSDAAIDAKRTDPRLQDVLMDDLMAANGAALRRAGQAETPGNIYLAHFAGSDGAVRLLNADPAARAADVLGADAARANPWMRDMSAADLIRWAERKMGQDYPSPRGGERVEIAGGDPESGLQRQLQDDLDRLEGERLALEQGERPASPLIDPDDREIVPVDLGDAIPIVIPDKKPRVRRAPMDLMQFVASKGGLIPRGVEAVAGAVDQNKGHDLLTMFDGRRFVPGIGTLVRDSGMTLDRARELAVEAGYFGDRNRTDITTADLLDALDRQHRQGQRLFADKDLSEVEARRQRIQSAEDYAEFDQRLRNAAGDRGIDDLSDDDALRAYELWDGESFEATLDRVIGEHLDQAHMEVLAEFDPAVYAQRQLEEELGYGAGRREDGSDAGHAGQRQADAGDARQGGTDAADGGSPTAVPRSTDDAADGFDPDLIPEAQRAGWDEPDGALAEAQAHSIDHDFRAVVAKAGRVRALPRNNMLVDLSGYAPILYREMDVDRASDFLPNRESSGSRGEQDAYFADTPDLALGQSHNRGVLIEVDAAGLFGQINLDKPAARHLFEQGMAEYKLPGVGQGETRRGALAGAARQNVRAITIEPALVGQYGTTGFRRRVLEALDELAVQGWGRTELPDGRIEFRRPAPPVVEVDPNIVARQAQEAQLGAEAPLRGSAKTGQEQDGTMGLGLFDAADQPGFRLDEEGGAITPADLLAQLDAEEAAIKGIEDCL